MINAKIISEKMTDGSRAYGVQFEAEHGDRTRTLVTIACISERAAERLSDALNYAGAYVVSDTVE